MAVSALFASTSATTAGITGHTTNEAMASTRATTADDSVSCCW
jgi:hypothetical protein